MKIDMKRMARAAGRFFRMLWGLLAQNLGMKLLSVLFALFLWSYVITSSPSITREKTLTGLDVNVTGQSVLTNRELALLSLKEVSDAQVRVRVSHSSYAQVTNDNVRVDLDLSSIRAAGKQQVRLRGSSTYGSVIQVIPEYVEVEVEMRDERVVPVNVELTGGDPDHYWYAPGRANPSQVTVSGPASVVPAVSSALVRPDVSGHFEHYSTREQYVLLDAQGGEVTDPLTRSTSSILVPIEIYPTRLLNVTANVSELITGQVAEGYEVTRVDVSPAQITVAAEASLLDTLSELTIEPVDVSGMSQTFPKVARVTALKGVQNLSSEEVNVTVVIEEKKTTKKLRNIDIEFINPPEGKRLAYSTKRVDLVRVTGPASIVNELNLTKDDIVATVNLAGLVAGQYEVPVELSVENHPELSCTSSTLAVTVTVD